MLIASVGELHTPDYFSLEKQKNLKELGCSVHPFTIVIIKLQLFKIVRVFIPNQIRKRKVYVEVLLFGRVSHQL